MHTSDAVENLKSLGYSIAVSSPRIYRVEGHGVDLHVGEDDAETWGSLVDEDAHAERAAQHAEAGEGV